MKAENAKIIAGVLLVSTLAWGILGVYLHSSAGGGDSGALNEVGQTLCLVNPVLAKTMSLASTFLDEEAGLSSYLNIGQPLNLAAAKTASWSGIEDETDDYIIGSIRLPGLTADDDVHCFVHRAGWIVTYYLKGEPTSKIVDWDSWDQNTRKLTDNKLQVGLRQVTNVLGVVATDLKYYHFQHPNATECMLIFRTLVGSGENSFTVTIPSDITVYERSWSHYAEITHNGGFGYIKSSYFKVDGNTINSIVGSYDPVTNHGTLSVAQLIPGVAHVVSITSNYDNHLYGACLGLVYREP